MMSKTLLKGSTASKLLLTLIAIMGLGSMQVMADTSIVGPEDNLNDGYYSGDHKKNYSLEPGKTITIEFTVSTATDDQLEGDVWNPCYAWAVKFWDGTLNAITIEPRNYGWETNTDNTRWTENWVKSWEINYPDDWESGYNFRDNMLQGATVVTTIKRDGADVIIIYDITTTSKAKYRQYVVKTYGDGTKTIWFDLIVDHCHITIDNDKTVTTDTENVVPTYEITMKDGVKDADKWTVKVGEGQAQALPIGGLKGDGSETVTLQYNGRLKVKGVKATSDEQEATVVDLSTISDDTYTVTGDVILTGTPTESEFYIKYGGDDYEVTLDNVNSTGSKQVLVDGDRHNINIKLKGTSRLKEIYTGDMINKTVTIGEAAAGGTLILTGSTDPIRGKTLTINGGTVKSQATGDNWAVYLNNTAGVLTINGGALYLAAGDDETQAVKGTVSGTLYGWNGSAWVTYTNQRYATTDNSKAPSEWTW